MRCRRDWEPGGVAPAGRRWKRDDTGWNPPLQWRWWALITAKQYQTESPTHISFTRQPAPRRKRSTRQQGGNSP